MLKRLRKDHIRECKETPKPTSKHILVAKAVCAFFEQDVQNKRREDQWKMFCAHLTEDFLYKCQVFKPSDLTLRSQGLLHL